MEYTVCYILRGTLELRDKGSLASRVISISEEGGEYGQKFISLCIPGNRTGGKEGGRERKKNKADIQDTPAKTEDGWEGSREKETHRTSR